jgi:hypothetical protein
VLSALAYSISGKCVKDLREIGWRERIDVAEDGDSGRLL